MLNCNKRLLCMLQMRTLCPFFAQFIAEQSRCSESVAPSCHHSYPIPLRLFPFLRAVSQLVRAISQPFTLQVLTSVCTYSTERNLNPNGGNTNWEQLRHWGDPFLWTLKLELALWCIFETINALSLVIHTKLKGNTFCKFLLGRLRKYKLSIKNLTHFFGLNPSIHRMLLFDVNFALSY